MIKNQIKADEIRKQFEIASKSIEAYKNLLKEQEKIKKKLIIHITKMMTDF